MVFGEMVRAERKSRPDVAWWNFALLVTVVEVDVNADVQRPSFLSRPGLEIETVRYGR